jgi:hypothetical protein
MFKIRKERGRELFDIIDVDTKEIVNKQTTRKLAKQSMENLILLRNRKFGIKSDLDNFQKTKSEPKLKQKTDKIKPDLIKIDKVKELSEKKKVQFASDRPTANIVVSATEPKLVRKKKMEDRIARAKPTLPFESSRPVAPVATPSIETKEEKRQKMLARLERNRPLKILLPADAEAIDKQKKKELKVSEKKLVNELKAKQKVGEFVLKKQKEKKEKEKEKEKIDAQKEKISQKKAELKASDVNRSQKLAQRDLSQIGEDAIQMQLAKKAKVEKVKADKKIKAEEAKAKKEQVQEARVTARMNKQLALIEAKQRKEAEKEKLKEERALAKVDLGEIARKAKLVEQDKKQSQAYLGEIARKQRIKDEKLLQAKLGEIERKNQDLAARSLQEIYLASKSAKSKKEVEKETKRQTKLADIERRDKETKAKFEQARLGAIERKIKENDQKKKELSDLGDIKRENRAAKSIAKLFKKNAELQGIQRNEKRPTKEEKQIFKHTPFQDMWRNPKTGEDATEAELLALGFKQKPNMDFVLQPKLFEKRAKLTELFEKVPSEVMYTNNKDKVLTPKQYEKLSAKKQKDFELVPELDMYKSNISGVVLSQSELIDKGFIEKDGNYSLSKLAQRLKASQEKEKPKVTSKPTDLVTHIVSQIEVPPESAPIVWNNPVIGPSPLIQPPEPPSPVQIEHYRKYENKMDGTIIYIDSNTNIVYDNHAKAIGVRNDKQKHILNLAKTNLDLNDFNLVKLSSAMD